LTGVRPTLHDGLVRRLIAFALVLCFALSQPLREAGSPERETAPATSEASAPTQGPSRVLAVFPHMAAGSAGAMHGRPASETLAAANWSFTPPDDSFSSSVPSARFRHHLSHPLREFPLLI
jgi:hypothetical protein